ncbi:NrfD/PsrC family molybdoenzyme membrane anchor subunit [Limisalsivibrio acetivorans]|uniref:NrfD/PsrC family molybdoenzyme membrane anchor subunit n=1 Tax=Limisalsivibrio acetivorans TaxID=1304888 RepID=UPI0003B62729|nr:NrfD/PsrC family molybdoenzyme membrane anchor subunit [Limisalsivibrio acetivorans]
MEFQEAFEWYVAAYLFLAGVGAGAIVAAALADMYDREKYLSFIKAASVIGMPLVSIGIGFLYIDLGQGFWKPWLLILLFANPTSAITWGTAILTLFTLFSLVYGAYNLGFIKFSGGNTMRWLLIITGVLTAGYTAVLLGVLKAIPFWHQTALPILFIISATSTGISGAMLVKEVFFKNHDHLGKIESTHMYLLILEIFLLAGMFLIALQGVPEMKYSAMSLLTGKFALEFWLFLVFGGLLIPAVAFALAEGGKMKISGGKLVLFEVLVLVGGYFLRHLIIHAGVYTQKFTEYLH